jgi:ribosomal protein S18
MQKIDMMIANKRKEAERAFDREKLRAICLTAVEDTQNIIKKILSTRTIPYKQVDQLQGYLVNLGRITPQITNQQDIAELRKYALASIDMMGRIYNGFKS